MSLINDALRRATTQNTKRDPNEVPTMQPTFKPIRAGGPGFSIFIVCFLIAAALTLGLWVYWRRGLAATTAKPAPVPAAAPNTNNNPIARAARTLGKVDALNKEGEATADNVQQQTAAAPTPNPVPAVGAPTAPVATTGATTKGPKLQGIFYSATNPSAIINGKSVKVGDEVEGLKVLAITRQSVRVQTGAETRELTMK
jgi:hypothetical protein